MIDNELVGKILLEINERHKHLSNLFPDGNNHLLKHLAASSIHMAFFSRDLHDVITGTKTEIDKNLENKFINECGCNFKEKK